MPCKPIKNHPTYISLFDKIYTYFCLNTLQYSQDSKLWSTKITVDPECKHNNYAQPSYFQGANKLGE